MDAIFKFHKCGFEVCAVVCDGASSNMTMVKELTGAEQKAYGWVNINDSVSFIKFNILFLVQKQW